MASNSTSTEHLVNNGGGSVQSLCSNKSNFMGSRKCSLNVLPDKTLTAIEKRFLLFVERGDCASVRRTLAENKDKSHEFDINCVDPLNRSALIAAIENENVELIYILLENDIQVKDALLHAIKEEYVEAVEILLEFEERHHVQGQPYSWEAVDRAQSTFTPDITPLILAAHMNNYEIIKILLDRGASLPTPHDVRCGCDECVASSNHDSLRHSQARINAYRALSSPSLIALSSRDPLLTAFELSWELRRLSRMETEFRHDYDEMREQVQKFATSLLDHARTSTELDVVLNHDPDGDSCERGGSLERLKLAIKYKQKKFVAHPNVQQLLASIWYDGLPGFRRKGVVKQVLQVAKIGAMFPVYSMIYLLAPNSSTSKLMTKPFVKFICYSASYAFFLLLLGAASQRVEYILIEWFGTEWMQEILADWKRRERGALPGLMECGVIIYVLSLIIWEARSLWQDGLMEYISDLWNIVDYVCNMCYATWLALRATAIFITWREQWNGLDPYYPREQWDPFDPMLLSEGMFAAGMILSFLKLVHIFSVNRHMGPLQISLGRMMIDILKFFFIYMLVLFAFGCGINQLLWYYADLEKNRCYHSPDGLPDFENHDMSCTIWRRFSNMFETSQSLFWASFGLVDLMAFELTGIKSFTRFWALLMFGSYSVINIIVLLNMLIAMMSNSYQIISERSDTEWKFARSKLWISYFEDGDVVPPPFNLVPGVRLAMDLCGKGGKSNRNSVKIRSRDKANERHETVARLLVKRFITAEQRKRDEFGVTEDDVIEIRQDISTLRFELVDILRNNGMKTPNIDSAEAAVHNKKGKILERRLMKDFHIGFIEGVVNDAIQSREPMDVFTRIARAIGRRGKGSLTKAPAPKDWNAQVQRRGTRRDPIGSASETERRRMSRQSLRRYIIEHEKSDMAQVDSSKIVEYNPRAASMTPAARVAYAKFKTRKIKAEYQHHEQLNKHSEVDEDEVFSAAISHADVNRPPKTAATSLMAAIRSTASLSSLNEVKVQIEHNEKDSINVGETSTPCVPTRSLKASAPPPPPSSATSEPRAASRPTMPSTSAKDGDKSFSATIAEKKTNGVDETAGKSLKSTTADTPSSQPKTTPKEEPATKREASSEGAGSSQATAESKGQQSMKFKAFEKPMAPNQGKSKVSGKMMEGWI